MLVERWCFSNLVQKFADVTRENAANDRVLCNRVSEREILFFRNALGAFNQVFLMHKLSRVRAILQDHSLKDFLLFNFAVLIVVGIAFLLGIDANRQRPNGSLELVDGPFDFLFLGEKVASDVKHHLDQLLGIYLVE